MLLTTDPLATTAFGDLVGVHSHGLMQGESYDNNPYTSANLEAALVASTETYPLWAGLPVSLGFQTAGNIKKGLIAKRSVVGDVAAGIMGWTTSQRQGSMGYSTTASIPPLAPQGGAINFYPNGSKGRIAVKINNTLAATLTTTPGFITTPVRWDFTNEELVEWISGTDAANLQLTTVRVIEIALASGTAYKNRAISYNTGTGIATWVENQSLAVIEV